MTNALATALAMSAGAAGVAGWIRPGWWILPLMAYGALFALLLRARRPLAAGVVGLAFGIGLQVGGHHWMYEALQYRVGLRAGAALAVMACFACYLASFTAVFCMIWHALQPRPARASPWSAAAFASLLTLGELARSTSFNGFTSLSLGYSLLDTWLAALAPVGGLYTLSLAGYLLAAHGVLLIGKRARSPTVCCVPLLILAAAGASACAQWVTPHAEPLTFSLIQTGVRQERKFDPGTRRSQIEQLVSLAEHHPADLVLTPETAFPLFFNELPAEFLARITQFSERSGSNLILGIPTFSADARGRNSLVQVVPGRAEMPVYHKRSLMPFGEYSPPGFHWFTGALDIPLKDLVPGEHEQDAFHVGPQAIGMLVCQEEMVGRDAAEWASTGIFINPTNLAWFDGSTAIDMFLQIARMRAMEIGRPVLRAANTGITAHIDHRGQILARLPGNAQGVLTGRVQAMRGATPYARWQDWPVLVVCLLVLVLAFCRCAGFGRVTPGSQGEHDSRVSPP